MNALAKEMQSIILHCNTAMAIWQDLKDRFEHKNGPLLYQLKRDLANLQQGPCLFSPIMPCCDHCGKLWLRSKLRTRVTVVVFNRGVSFLRWSMVLISLWV